jgi:hypothetical protein
MDFVNENKRACECCNTRQALTTINYSEVIMVIWNCRANSTHLKASPAYLIVWG